jgi:hypothetical protein
MSSAGEKTILSFMSGLDLVNRFKKIYIYVLSLAN